jgi:hypothetical protein
MYMWFDSMASVRRIHKEVHSILDVSRRAVCVGPDIFLRASPEEIRRQYYAMATTKAEDLPDDASKPVLRRLVGKQLPPKIRLSDMLCAGLRARYLQHREKIAKVRRMPGTCYVVDINKSVGWGGKPDCSRVPTILRSSKLVAVFESPEHDRLLLPSEMPGIHGMRLPSEVVASLAPREVRSLIGNSMHVAQIGCFIQYALATRSYKL